MHPIRVRVLALLFGLTAAGGACAAPPINTFGEGGGFFSDPPRTEIAIRGYDPVAYFLDGRPVPGSDRYVHVWRGARWKFASQAHLDRFVAAPEQYAPQYGGYCAYGVALGSAPPIDPQAWSIVDGKLYLNFNLPTRAVWEKDIPGYIRKADANWPGVLKK